VPVTTVQRRLAGRYELREVVGRGGMSVVHRAEDRVLGRVVAVKLLATERAQDPVFVARFEREARALAALNHRNIVRVFDAGRDRETRFIVMEHVTGRTLAQVAGSKPGPSVARAAQIVFEIAQALDAAHHAGIIHRDLKPANVMITEDGGVKVLDFGIARALADTSLTQTAVVLGSAPYLAPEVTRGDRADERSDVYSLGCVLYELLTGRPPFTGDLAAAILHQHNSARPWPPRELNPGVPRALDSLVLRMLAKTPSDRPQTANLVARDLARSAHVPVTARESKGPGAPPRTERSTDPTRRLVAMRRSPRPRVMAAALLACLLLSGVLVALLGSSARRPRRALTHHPVATASRGRGSPRPTTATQTRKAPARNGPGATAAAPPAPMTVPQAAGALMMLIAQDLRSGAVDQHGQDLLKHSQDILTAYEQGHIADGVHKVEDLAKHSVELSEHGDVQSSAFPAIVASINQLRAAMLRSAQPAGGPKEPPGPKRHRDKHSAGARGDG
jgi:predicted Ser/Thr protein kinase